MHFDEEPIYDQIWNPGPRVATLPELPLVYEGQPGQRPAHIFEQHCFTPLLFSLERRILELEAEGYSIEFNEAFEVPEAEDITEEEAASRRLSHAKALFFHEYLMGNLLAYGVPERITNQKEFVEALAQQKGNYALLTEDPGLRIADFNPGKVSRWLKRQEWLTPISRYQNITGLPLDNREVRLNFLRLQIRMLPDIIGEPDLLFLPNYVQDNTNVFNYRYPIGVSYNQVVPTYERYCKKKLDWINNQSDIKVKRTPSFYPLMEIFKRPDLSTPRRRNLMAPYLK